jgi:transposase
MCGGVKENLTLEDRVYKCGCGNVLDRDLNASINLEKYGLNRIKDTDSLSGIKACGESVRPTQVRLIEEAVSVMQEENIKFNTIRFK